MTDSRCAVRPRVRPWHSQSLCMSCLPDDENRVMDVAVENEAEVCMLSSS